MESPAVARDEPQHPAEPPNLLLPKAGRPQQAGLSSVGQFIGLLLARPFRTGCDRIRQPSPIGGAPF